jgi:hypothetical protein
VATSFPLGASRSRLGGQVRPEARAAVLPKAAQAVVAPASLSNRVVQGCLLAFPRLAGLGREFPKEVVARNGLAAGRIRSA